MNGFKGKVRTASHAGSWYTDNGSQLSNQLDGWLADAGEATRLGARAIIAPHAGYSYSGPCAAYAYKQIDPCNVKRIFILGPSHHKYLKGCALSKTKMYQTPLYDLIIDTGVNSELSSTGLFEEMSLGTDEHEHSIEMQLPYIAKLMKSKQGSFTIIPVLIGNLSYEKEQLYGRLFAKYLADPLNLFVISSDFCHWGKRFQYNQHDQSHGEIYQHIEHLDKTGMSLIESLNSKDFHAYLESSGNTICGRHPILVLMCTVDALSSSGSKFDFKFLHYSQSNKVRSTSESSVSYAAGSLTIA